MLYHTNEVVQEADKKEKVFGENMEYLFQLQEQKDDNILTQNHIPKLRK